MGSERQYARVFQQSWAGITSSRVEVLAETPKRYRVRWLEAGVGRHRGYVSLVPKYALTFEEPTNGE